MKKELGDYLHELAFKSKNSKIWYIFDKEHNLIASASPHVLWAMLGIMFTTKPIKGVLNKDHIIILDCECILKEGD